MGLLDSNKVKNTPDLFVKKEENVSLTKTGFIGSGSIIIGQYKLLSFYVEFGDTAKEHNLQLWGNAYDKNFKVLSLYKKDTDEEILSITDRGYYYIIVEKDNYAQFYNVTSVDDTVTITVVGSQVLPKLLPSFDNIENIKDSVNVIKNAIGENTIIKTGDISEFDLSDTGTVFNIEIPEGAKSLILNLTVSDDTADARIYIYNPTSYAYDSMGNIYQYIGKSGEYIIDVGTRQKNVILRSDHKTAGTVTVSGSYAYTKESVINVSELKPVQSIHEGVVDINQGNKSYRMFKLGTIVMPKVFKYIYIITAYYINDAVTKCTFELRAVNAFKFNGKNQFTNNEILAKSENNHYIKTQYIENTFENFDLWADFTDGASEGGKLYYKIMGVR